MLSEGTVQVIRKLEAENAALKAELDRYERIERDYKELKSFNDRHRAENARLKVQLDNAHKAGFEAGELANKLAAELEALRPKPVVEVKSLAVRVYPKLDKGRVYWAGIDDLDAAPNVRFTFTDGVLTKAEVLSDK